MLKNFATFNNLKITNGFLRKKISIKFWTRRKFRSIIEYVIDNNVAAQIGMYSGKLTKREAIRHLKFVH